MSDVVRIQGNLLWECFIGTGGNWVGICEPLNLTVQGGETFGELMEEIASTLDVILQDLFETGGFDQFLREHGWQVIGPLPTQPDVPVRFDVPFSASQVPAPIYGTQEHVYQ